jgi:hypothetical protein
MIATHCQSGQLVQEHKVVQAEAVEQRREAAPRVHIVEVTGPIQEERNRRVHVMGCWRPAPTVRRSFPAFGQHFRDIGRGVELEQAADESDRGRVAANGNMKGIVSLTLMNRKEMNKKNNSKKKFLNSKTKAKTKHKPSRSAQNSIFFCNKNSINWSRPFFAAKWSAFWPTSLRLLSNSG